MKIVEEVAVCTLCGEQPRRWWSFDGLCADCAGWDVVAVVMSGKKKETDIPLFSGDTPVDFCMGDFPWIPMTYDIYDEEDE